MPDQLQLRGGTTTEHNSFTGAAREVTVDTTKKTLVVHDGSQAGGTPLMKESGATAASSVQIGTGGVERLKLTSSEVVFNETSTDTDFRIESDTNTHALFVNAGNSRVGINTAAPNDELEVTGNVQVTSGSVKVTSSNPSIRFTDSDASGGFGMVGVNNTSGSLVMRSDDGNALSSTYMGFEVDGGEKVRIDSNGNVGIGTSSPSTKLHVKGGDAYLTLQGGASNSNAGILFKDSSGTQNSVILYDFDNDFLKISGTNDTERMRIDSSGNVGIGNSSPQNELHIGPADNSNHEAMIILNNGGASGQEAGIEFRYESGTTPRAKIHVNSSDTILRFSTADNERMRIDGSGNVGIGTTSPSDILDVVHAANTAAGISIRNTNNSQASAVAIVSIQGGDNASGRLELECNGQNHNLIEDSLGNLAIEDNGTELMRLNSSGNLGIGTASPSVKLHVSGGDGLLVERSAGTSIAGFKHSGSSTMNIYLQNTGSSNHPYVGSESQELTFGTNNSNRVKVNNVGDTIIFGVNVYEGARSLDINSTTTWSTFFTFSNNQANAFVARFTATENNNSTGYIVVGSVVGNQLVQSFMNETNHAHSKDVLFQLAGTGNTQLQVKANSFSTTRRVRLIDIFVSAGRPTYA